MAYYTKLPIVLLSELAAGKEDSNNCRIARYLLERLDCLEDVSIEGLAAECFVSKATVSRFCRDIGLDKIMVACLDTNPASRKIILSWGGVYDRTVHQPEEEIGRTAAQWLIRRLEGDGDPPRTVRLKCSLQF